MKRAVQIVGALVAVELVLLAGLTVGKHMTQRPQAPATVLAPAGPSSVPTTLQPTTTTTTTAGGRGTPTDPSVAPQPVSAQVSAPTTQPDPAARPGRGHHGHHG